MMRTTMYRAATDRRLLLLAVLAGLVACVVRPAQAQQQPLVADLSKHLVAITTGFAGTDVLLFGATGEPGDVILVIRGPTQDQVVRRKEKLGGVIWANRSSVTFGSVPSYYHVASNRPVEELLAEPALARNQIGIEHIGMAVEGLEPGESPEAFRRALFRLKRHDGLYSYDPRAVQLLANRLFRAELRFPSNVPTGTYMVEVYLVRDGEIVGAEITPLIISKVGVGADLFLFATEQAPLYGLAAIFVAVFAGWVAGAAFRKG